MKEEELLRDRVKEIVAGVKFGTTPTHKAVVELMVMLRTDSKAEERTCMECKRILPNNWLPSFCPDCRNPKAEEIKWPEEKPLNALRNLQAIGWNACLAEFKRLNGGKE